MTETASEKRYRLKELRQLIAGLPEPLDDATFDALGEIQLELRTKHQAMVEDIDNMTPEEYLVKFKQLTDATNVKFRALLGDERFALIFGTGDFPLDDELFLRLEKERRAVGIRFP